MENQNNDVQAQEPQQQTADTLTGQQQNAEQAQPQQQQGAVQQQNPATNINPVTYDFSGVQMPEGFTLDEVEANQFKDVIKDMGLSNEQAGAIVKFGTEYANRIVETVTKEYEDTIKGWGETAKQQLGGDFDKTVSLACVARDKFPGLKEALEESGAGNRVEVIRALAKLGEYISGDPGMIKNQGNSSSRGADPVNDPSVLYPNTDFSKYR